jgi:hypothetical protein
VSSQIVHVQVTAGIPIDCDFWAEGDGWLGRCEFLSVAVTGTSFEDAKKNMAGELQTHIEKILSAAVQGAQLRIA